MNRDRPSWEGNHLLRCSDPAEIIITPVLAGTYGQISKGPYQASRQPPARFTAAPWRVRLAEVWCRFSSSIHPGLSPDRETNSSRVPDRLQDARWKPCARTHLADYLWVKV